MHDDVEIVKVEEIFSVWTYCFRRSIESKENFKFGFQVQMMITFVSIRLWTLSRSGWRSSIEWSSAMSC